jgi:hypothetical protein
MKKSYSLFFACITVFMLQNIRAQVWLGVYGLHTNSTGNLLSPDVGGGFAISMLSEQKKLTTVPTAKMPAGTTPSDIMKDGSTGFRFQMGGSFYYSGLGQRSFTNVPLNAPQIGLARVTLSNALWGMNLLGRMSYANKSIFTPYADAFIGYRGTYSGLDIVPYMHIAGYEPQTTQSLSQVSGLNYGIGGGIMTNLTKRIRLDLGVSYSEAFQYGGHVADLRTTYSDASGIYLTMKDAPNGLLMVHAGLQFYIRDNGNSNCNCNCNHGSTRIGTGIRAGGWGGGGTRSSINVHSGGFGGGFRAK